MRVGRERERAAVRGEPGRDDPQFAARSRFLPVHRLVGRFQRFEPVGSGDVFTKLDVHCIQPVGDGEINRLVEGDLDFHRASRPDRDWLRRPRVGIGNLEDFSFAVRSGSPVG